MQFGAGESLEQATAKRVAYLIGADGKVKRVWPKATPATFAVTPGRSIDPDFHQPYVQEWGVGYVKQLRSQLTAGVDVVHRDFRDRPTLVETNGRYNGNIFVGFIDEAFNQVYQATNNRWNWPVYTSLELSLTQIKLLHVLEDSSEELTLKEAAALVHVSLPAASRMVESRTRGGAGLGRICFATPKPGFAMKNTSPTPGTLMPLSSSVLT